MEDSPLPKTSFLSQKLPGGQALVNSIQQKIRHASSIRDLLVAMEGQVHSGGIFLMDLVATMEKHLVFLDKRECDLLDRRFTNSSGDLDYGRLIKTLDIGTPVEHVDPEHFEDVLPQPYRMISKILELEIIDVAWLEILRHHPEVAEDIPGAEGVARRNRNLDRECHPSSQQDKPKQVAVLGAGGELAYSINVEGSFQVMSHASGRVLRTLQLFPLEVSEDDGEEEEEGSQEKAAVVAEPVRKDGSLVQKIVMSAPSVALAPDYLSRIAVLRVETNYPMPSREDDAAVAAKRGNKKASDKTVAASDECEVAPFKCLVTLVETSGKAKLDFECRVLKGFECLLTDPNVQAELSLDARVLTITHGMTVDFFKLVPMVPIVDPLNNNNNCNTQSMGVPTTLMPTTDEDDESFVEGGQPVPVVATPLPLCQWNIQDEIVRQTDKNYSHSANPSERMKHESLLKSLSNSRVWRSFLFPFQPSMQWDDSKLRSKRRGKAGGESEDLVAQLPLSATPFLQEQKLVREFQNGFVVFLEDVKAFFVFGLRNMSEDERKAHADKRRVEEGEGAGDESPLLSSNPPSLELITFWPLSASVTAVDTDPHKALLVLGQADGVLTMWDLRSLQMIDVPARHHSLVTSVALTGSSRAYSLVSGDQEGTLCFFNLAVPCMEGAPGGGGSPPEVAGKEGRSPLPVGRDGQQCVKAELVDFRMDFSKEVIANILAIPETPIVIVQLESMKLVAYDAETAELYGRLSLTSGIPGQRISFSLVQTEAAVHYHSVPPLTEEEENARQQQLEEEAAKASKGKKGKQVAPSSGLSTASQEELGLETVPPEPSAYLQRERGAGLICVSSEGVCGVFTVDDEREVKSTFSTERLITFFCPGVASALRHLSAASNASFDTSQPSALDVYRVLSKEERNDENLKPSQVSSLQEPVVGSNEGSVTSKFSQTNQSTFKRTGGLSAAPSSLLTEAKLKALQKTFSPFDSVGALPPISACVRQKVTLPTELFRKSCKASQADRAKRKRTLLGRMEALSAMC